MTCTVFAGNDQIYQDESLTPQELSDSYCHYDHKVYTVNMVTAVTMQENCKL